MSKTNNIGTFTLTANGGPNSDGVYTIMETDGVAVAAFKLLTGGTATIEGAATIKGFGGGSGSIDLVVDESTVFSTNNENEFIDNLVITVTAGEVLVITNQ